MLSIYMGWSALEKRATKRVIERGIANSMKASNDIAQYHMESFRPCRIADLRSGSMSMWIGKVYQQVTKVAMLMYRHCIAPGLFTFAYPVINYVCLTVKAMFVVTMVFWCNLPFHSVPCRGHSTTSQ